MGAFKVFDELLGKDFSAQEKYNKPPRTGLAFLAYLCSSITDLKLLNVFGMERDVRVEGPEHFYKDGSKQRRAIERRENKHCKIEDEMFLFNEALNNFKIGFYD